MRTLMSYIRRVPARVSVVAAVIAAAIIIPTASLAWGPERPTFTGANPADYNTFNSITDNPDVGDERNFVRIREDADGTTFTDSVTLEPGKVYEMMVYYHNNAAADLNLTALDTTLRMEVPGVVEPGVNAVLAGNITSSNATPATVWDEAYGKNNTNAQIALRYVENSAVITSNGAVNGAVLSEDLFSDGVYLGYDALDGKVPGCNEFAGYVTFKFRVDQPNFTIKKQVSVDNGETWEDDTAEAEAGSTIQYRLIYQNTGTTQLDNVSLRDILPENVTYVEGSSVAATANSDGKYVAVKDGITTTGYNVGSYQPKANVYFKFSAKIADEEDLACGVNELVNTGRATTSAGYKEDDATVTVTKECDETKTMEVCELDSGKIVTIEDTDFDSEKHSTDLDDCDTPEELPTTGPAEGIVAVIGLGALVGSIAYYIASRRALDL